MGFNWSVVRNVNGVPKIGTSDADIADMFPTFYELGEEDFGLDTIRCKGDREFYFYLLDNGVQWRVTRDPAYPKEVEVYFRPKDFGAAHSWAFDHDEFFESRVDEICELLKRDRSLWLKGSF